MEPKGGQSHPKERRIRSKDIHRRATNHKTIYTKKPNAESRSTAIQWPASNILSYIACCLPPSVFCGTPMPDPVIPGVRPLPTGGSSAATPVPAVTQEVFHFHVPEKCHSGTAAACQEYQQIREILYKSMSGYNAIFGFLL